MVAQVLAASDRGPCGHSSYRGIALLCTKHLEALSNELGATDCVHDMLQLLSGIPLLTVRTLGGINCLDRGSERLCVNDPLWHVDRV